MLKAQQRFSLFLFLILSVHAYGMQLPTFENSKMLNSMVVNDTLLLHDDLLSTLTPANTDWTVGYCFNDVKGKVTFGVTETPATCMPTQFTATVTVRISYRTDDNTLQVTTETLNLNFTKEPGQNYQEKDIRVLDKAHYIKVELLSATYSVSGISQFLYLRSEICEDRYLCAPNVTNQPAIESVSMDAATNEIVIKIDTLLIKHADEYDLEWTFVDEYDELSQQTLGRYFDFRNNATRVTLTALQYRLTNIFEQGYVVFRVRVVEYYTDPSTGGKRRVEGAWSIIPETVGSDNMDYSYIEKNPDCWIHIDDVLAHQQALNWQYMANYAEEGKKNEGISYFDGSLYKRQSVSHNFSDATAIVGETIYDYQGRPAIEVLPVPVKNGKITFYPGFNLNTGDQPYTKEDFDKDATGSSCVTATAPMKNTSGSEGYYSSANAFSTASLGVSAPVPNFNDYIPISAGYPFVQTEYMNDNTGRVLSKTLPGATHKLGSGHETNYEYSVPNQEELDKLFGNEVGIANHYKKNTVIDPNGQVSISYQDLSGHTIATALSGAAPSATNALSSNAATVNNITNLIGPYDLPRIENNQIIVSKTITADQDGPQGFYYEMTPQKYMPGYCEGNTPPCYDCIYDLTISLTNLCGEEQFNGNGGTTKILISRTLGGSPSTIDGSCTTAQTYSFVSDAVLAGSIQDGYLAVNLVKGTTYTLTKTLTVNKQVLDDYVNHYLANQTCKTLTDFENEEWDRMDKTGCDMTCQDCEAQLLQPQYASRGAYMTFQCNQYIAGGGNPLDTPALKPDWGDSYDNIKKRCDQVCGRMSDCDMYREMLIADIAPGGQYAQYQYNSSGQVEPVASGMMNLLATVSPATKPLYTTYFTDDDKVTINGVEVKVKDLDLPTFIQYWDANEKAWSEKLLPSHPEYCEISWCELTEVSKTFDEAMLNTETYDDAVTAGYLQTGTGVGNLKVIVTAAQGSNDPFFTQMSVDEGAAENTLVAQLYNYQPASGVLISLWDMPVIEMFCQGVATDDVPACVAAHRDSILSCKAYKDYYWKTVRGLYISAKQQILDENKTTCSGEAPINPPAMRRILSTQNGLSSQTPSIPATDTYVTGKITEQCAAQCEAYIPEWKAALNGCALDTAELNQVIAKMVDVCKRGCDADHPFGSSTVAPSQVSTTDYNSFEDIFSQPFAFSSPGTTKPIYVKDLCDNLLITMPGSYNHDYFAKTSPLANKCACNPTLAASDPNCPCAGNNAALNITDVINGMRTDVPDEKKCSNCMDCAAFTEYYRMYLNKYTTYRDTSSTDRELLTSYMNQKAGFNLTYDDYKNHLISCLGYDSLNDPFSLLDSLHLVSLPLSPDINNLSVTVPPDTLNQGGLPYPHNEISCEDFMNVVDQFFSDSARDFNSAFGLPEVDIYRWIDDHSTSDAADLITQLNTEFPDAYSSAGFSIARLKEQFHSCLPLNCQQFRKYWILAGTNLFPTRSNLLDPAKQTSVQQAITNFNIYLDTLSANNPVWIYANNPDIAVIPAYAYYPKFNQHLLLQYADMCQQSNLCPINLKNGGVQDVTSSPAKLLNEFTKPCGSSFGVCQLLALSNWTVSITDPDILDIIPYKFKNPGSLKYSYTVGSTIAGPYNSNSFTINLNGLNELPFVIKMRTISYMGTMQHYQYSDPSSDFGFDRITEFIPVEKIGYNYSNLVMIFKAKYSTESGDHYQYLLVSFPTYAFSSELQGELCYPTHSLCNKSISQVDITLAESPCMMRLRNVAKTNALANWNNYLDGLRDDFANAYLAKCLEASQTEVLKRRYDERKYHYTLYYYDRGGNLVKTVPPAGVTILTTTQVTSAQSKRGVQTFSDLFGGAPPNVVLPSHTLATQYTYNTLNQLAEQKTPDAGASDFLYNRVGQIILSRNAKQRNDWNFSYTLYDDLGRITQVGEIAEDFWTAPTQAEMMASPDKDISEVLDFYWQFALLTDVTSTYYDQAYISPAGFTQTNLRKRVAHSAFNKSYDPTMEVNDDADQVIHYSYDIAGNVKTLCRENKSLSVIGHDLKILDYEYDLVSGKVKKVTYQPLELDQYIHEYSYDLDNRIKSVNTGTSRWTMDQDAAYRYYPHGPLARTEIGSIQLQGIDYSYTIQGWLKGVNSSSKQMGLDIGKDGYTGLAGNTHMSICPDVFGFSLHYFEGDYSAIQTFTAAQQFNSVTSGSTLSNNAPSLYNGNIAMMVTSIEPFNWPLATGYTYDQLNRLNSATYYNNYNPYSNSWKTDNSIADYYNKLTYDANGNITQQIRRGGALLPGDINPTTNLLMDSLTYNYYSGTNQLKQVTDGVYSTAYLDDIDNQGSTTNYGYDEIGNLIKDDAEEIQSIDWNVYGKITKITRVSGSMKPDLEFEYTPDGHRSMKITTPKTGSGFKNYTYYVHDAQGNIMATYQRSFNALPADTFVDNLDLNDWQLFGSSRIGMSSAGIRLISATYTATSYSDVSSRVEQYSSEPSLQFVDYTFLRGNRRYEFTNHLGNVLAVISDKHIQPCNVVELVSDFSIADDASWPVYGSGTRVYNSARGRLELTPQFSGNPTVTRNITSLTVGAVYKATFTMDLNNVSGNIWRLVSYPSPLTTSSTVVKRLDSERGIKEYSFVFKARSTTHTLAIVSENGGTVFLYKVVLQRLDTGKMANGMILNEDYNDGVSVAGWAPWSDNLTVTNVSGKIKVATISAPALSALEGVQKSYNTVPGHVYHVHAYIERTGIDNSAFWFGNWDGDYVQWSYQFAAKDYNNATNNGWYDFYFMAKSTTSKLGTYNIATSGVGAYSYTIDNLTVEEVYLPERQVDLLHANDYSPFGAPLPARSFKVQGVAKNNLVLYDQFVYGKDAWTPDGTTTLTATNQYKLKIEGSGAWRTSFDVKPNHTYTLDLDYLNNGTEAGVINVINASTSSLITSFNLDGDTKSFTFTTDGSTTLVKFYLGRTSTNAASYLVDNIMVKDITTVNPTAPQEGRITKYKFDFNDGTAQGFVGVTGNNTATASSATLLVSGFQKNSITCSRVFNGLVAGTTYTVTFSIADAGPSYNTYKINVNQPGGTNIANVTYTTPGIHDITFTVPSGLTSVTFAISGERTLPNYSNVFNVDNVTLTYMGTINALQTASGYRYGFNGKERTDEMYGAGNTYDYGFRIYEARLGRFLSVDPLFKSYAELTPYQFASNIPTRCIDLDGLEAADPMYYMVEGFRQYFDAVVNLFTFDFSASVNIAKTHSTQSNGITTKTDQTKTTAGVTATYSGWDLFNPNAYPANPTVGDIPAPSGNIKSTITVKNEKTIKTQLSPATTQTNTTTKTPNGEVVKKVSMSTTVVSNTGTPVTGSVSQSQSNTGTNTTDLKLSVGPSNANVFIQNTTTTTSNGASTNTTVLGGTVSGQTPPVNGTSVGGEATLKVGVKTP